MNKMAKIYVAGHTGLVGSAIVKRLQQKAYTNLLLRTHEELDLLDQQKTRDFIQDQKPDYIFLAAAKVGGIHANNKYRGDFIYQNLMITLNVINAAKHAGINRLLFLGSSCIYPKLCPQPIKEKYLLSGLLEPTNEPYAIAKIAGVKLCESYNRQYQTRYFAAMPTNIYGPNDNFDLENSHVLPALIRKIHEAKIENRAEVTLWGSGKPKREFLYVSDLADACVFIMEHDCEPDLYNVGCGSDISIQALAQLVAKVVDYKGKFVFDASRPDGTPRKLLDVSKLTGKGWTAKVGLQQGIEQTYRWYLQQDVARDGLMTLTE